MVSFRVLLRAGMYNERTLQVGFEVRRLSHMKRAVRPRVKMKLKQHRQQPPDSAIFDLLRKN